MADRYKNKRLVKRVGGRYAKVTAYDFGIGGACKVCRHLLIRVYDGDQKAEHIDPRLFRYRCFTCEPLTEVEQKARDEKIANEPKFSMDDFFSEAGK